MFLLYPLVHTSTVESVTKVVTFSDSSINFEKVEIEKVHARISFEIIGRRARFLEKRRDRKEMGYNFCCVSSHCMHAELIPTSDASEQMTLYLELLGIVKLIFKRQSRSTSFHLLRCTLVHRNGTPGLHNKYNCNAISLKPGMCVEMYWIQQSLDKSSAWLFGIDHFEIACNFSVSIVIFFSVKSILFPRNVNDL